MESNEKMRDDTQNLGGKYGGYFIHCIWNSKVIKNEY